MTKYIRKFYLACFRLQNYEYFPTRQFHILRQFFHNLPSPKTIGAAPPSGGAANIKFVLPCFQYERLLKHSFHRLLISKQPRDTLFTHFQNHLTLARVYFPVIKIIWGRREPF